MRNKNLTIAACLLLVPLLLLTSCGGVTDGDKKSPVELLNDKISAIDTGVGSFTDVEAICASFNGVFDDLEALGNTDGVYVDQLKNKCTGFYSTYQLMTEDANGAIDVVVSIFAAETSQRVARLLLDADRAGAIYIDQEEFLDVLSVVSQDYALFTTLNAENSYFTVGKYTYEDFAKKVETALFSLNNAYEYYKKTTIDTAETISAFKQYFSASVDAMADVAKMHSETLDLMSRDAEAVLAFIDRMHQCLPE